MTKGCDMKRYFLALGTLLVVCVGCAVDGQQLTHNQEHVAPPANMLARPGMAVDGPGPGVMNPITPVGYNAAMPPQMAPGMMMGAPMMSAPAMHGPAMTRTSQVRFAGPAGMAVGWQVPGGFADNQLVAPGRYNFKQGATYRLKVSSIPGREGEVYYPTLQVYPAHPTTDAYLSNTSLPVQITDEDLNQVKTNNFVTKVVFLPEPQFQELAIAGVETLVSTSLLPGEDPVQLADQRGTIMAVIRIGNKDFEMPGAVSEGGINTVNYIQADGMNGQFVEPMPIAGAGTGSSIPAPQVMGSSGGPGMPPYNPVAGVGGAPAWGMPITATPIGLPGPNHLPYGGAASLKSYTTRNMSNNKIPKPVEHFLVDVRHEPGYSVPEPVRHVEYTEKHPVFGPGQVSVPAGGAGAYCPPSAGY